MLLASLCTAAFHAVLVSIIDALSADAELSLLERFIFLELDTFLALLFHSWNRVANFLELIGWWYIWCGRLSQGGDERPFAAPVAASIRAVKRIDDVILERIL